MVWVQIFASYVVLSVLHCCSSKQPLFVDLDVNYFREIRGTKKYNFEDFHKYMTIPNCNSNRPIIGPILTT